MDKTKLCLVYHHLLLLLMRQMLDDFIFAFFAVEMSIKMVAMGIYGKGTYLAETWNRLDCFIVVAG
jgi:voltage-dependent calcium channel T type alpha-1G